MTKPTVEYSGEAVFFDLYNKPDWPVALVYGVDHPILGTRKIRTSKIINKQDNGDFETLNTFYKKIV